MSAGIAERIQVAGSASELHTIAAEAAATPMPDIERAELQALYAVRCRELWPSACRPRRQS